VPEVERRVSFLPTVGLTEAASHAQRFVAFQALPLKHLPVDRAIETIDDTPCDLFRDRAIFPMNGSANGSGKLQSVQVLQAVFKGRRHFGKDLLDGTHAVDAGDAVELVILADDRHGLCLVFLACQETTLPVRTPQPKNPVKLKLSLLA
jgi:hypothetical protein